jgi:hypothetical protein
MRLRHFAFGALLALAACHPSVPEAGQPDAGTVPPTPDAMPDSQPLPPPTAMETVSAAGHLTAGTFTLDVQLGGMTRSSASAADYGLDTAPVLH